MSDRNDVSSVEENLETKTTEELFNEAYEAAAEKHGIETEEERSETANEAPAQQKAEETVPEIKEGQTQEVSNSEEKKSIDVNMPPHGLTLDEKTKWNTWPEEARKAFLTMSENREEHYKNGLAELKTLKEYREEVREIEPFRRNIEQNMGISFTQAVKYYADLENAFASNPEEFILHLASSRNVDLNKLAGQSTSPNRNASVAPSNEYDQRLRAIEQAEYNRQNQMLADRNATIENELKKEVVEFTKNAPYFFDLKDDIAFLLDTQKANDLAHAYELACNMNPIVREKLIEEKFQAREAERKAKAKSQAGLRKSSSLNGYPTPGSSSDGVDTTKLTTRQAMEDAFRKHSG